MHSAMSSTSSPFLSTRFPRTSQQPPRLQHNPSSDAYSLHELDPHPIARQEEPFFSSTTRTMPISKKFETSPPPRMATSNAHPLRTFDQQNPRLVFDGPPPPIVSSTVLPRPSTTTRHKGKDPELGVSYTASSNNPSFLSPPRASATRPSPSRTSTGGISSVSSSSRRSATNAGPRFPPPPVARSVRFSAPAATAAPNLSEEATIWRSLHRRERGIKEEIQVFLTAQETGLVSSSGAPPPPSDDASSVSSSNYGGALHGHDSRTPTPTSSTFPDTGRNNATSSAAMSSVILDATTTHHRANGSVMPIRQPKPKPLTLRAARAGLSRSIASLASIKADECDLLSSCISLRQSALSHLGTLATRREKARGELETLERDPEEPLGKEVEALKGESEDLGKEIAELEERVRELRQRKEAVDERVGVVQSRREAGLSGYRGAVKEAEGEVGECLRRPGIRPLEGWEVPVGAAQDGENGGGCEGGGKRPGARRQESFGGTEFLNLRPERRTAEMAWDWWEKEVAVLEKRMKDVETESAALEEGMEVWKACRIVVADVEAGLRAEVTLSASVIARDNTKGKMKDGGGLRGLYDRMTVAMQELDVLLAHVEENGWTLLICAVGAELESIRQGRKGLRELLVGMGYDVPDDDDDDEAGEPGGLRPSGRGNGDVTPKNGAELEVKNLFDLHGVPDESRKAHGNAAAIGFDTVTSNRSSTSTPVTTTAPSIVASKGAATVSLSASGTTAFKREAEPDSKSTSRGIENDADSHEPESEDNEVPRDLLLSRHESNGDRDSSSRDGDPPSSLIHEPEESIGSGVEENEIPPEFLAEHL